MTSAGLFGTRIHDIASPGAGAPYRLFVHVPAGDPPPQGWPLLVMSDGNAYVATAVDAMRAQAPYPGGTNVSEGVIAAIGYPTDRPYDPYRRSFDLTPPPGRSYPPFTAEGPEARTGGAELFLDALESTILPYLGTLAPLDPARRTLFGHSFGGLFALHTLFTRDWLFQAYVAASPTIFWEEGGLLETERAARFSRTRKPVVHLSAGEYEGERLAPFQEGKPDSETRRAERRVARTIDLAREMAERLARPDGAGLEARFELFAGETHMSAPFPAIGRAVQIAFAVAGDAQGGAPEVE